MAKSTGRLLERLAAQQEQQRQAERLAAQQRQAAQRARNPPAVSAKPVTTQQKQGRGTVNPPAKPPASAEPGSSSAGKLTLKPGTAPPPQVAERIKQMQPSPAKPEPPQARDKWKKKRKHNGPSLIERLAAMYPTTFDFHAPVPLAVAVDHQIAAALGIHPRLAEDALARWTNRMNYLAAMAAPGSRRFNLDGSDAGSVDDEHRAQAAAKLAEKMAVTLPKAAVSEGNA